MTMPQSRQVLRWSFLMSSRYGSVHCYPGGRDVVSYAGVNAHRLLCRFTEVSGFLLVYQLHDHSPRLQRDPDRAWLLVCGHSLVGPEPGGGDSLHSYGGPAVRLHFKVLDTGLGDLERAVLVRICDDLSGSFFG